MEDSLKVMAVGVLTTFFSFLIDNEDILFRIARWIPILLSTIYIIWKWRIEIENKNTNN